MFLARQGALIPLHNLGLQWSGYLPEPLSCDGTQQRAVEELLTLIAASRGFKHALSHMPGLSR